MKAINYILGFVGFAAAVAAAIWISRFADFAWRCHDIPLAMSCTFGAVWFFALAVRWPRRATPYDTGARATSGEIGGASHGKSRDGEHEACARA